MKTCYRCEKTKEISEFHKDRTAKDGHSYECKMCRSEFRRQKRKENPEKYREACRISTKKNYETIRESQRQHRIKNREKILARRRELREPRKHELNAKEKERRKKDPHFLIKERIRQKRFRDRNKEILKPKTDAHKLVMFAVKLGFLTRSPTCEECGVKGKIEGHHEDYTKPLEVKWLCKLCHRQKHKRYKDD